MLRTTTCLFLVAMTLVATPQPAAATNTGFLPGDAFFHTRLTSEQIQSLNEVADQVFVYRPPVNTPTVLSGYAGFWELHYTAMPEPLRLNLQKLCLQLRTTRYPLRVKRRENERELNPFDLFIYPADFDETKTRVALKFNEDWTRHTLRFPTFVPVSDLVAYEWQRASRVPALAVSVPFELKSGKKSGEKPSWYERKTGLPTGGAEIKEAITLSGPTKLILIPSATNSVSSVQRGKEDAPQKDIVAVARMNNGAVMFVVTAEQVERLEYRRGEWIRTDPFAADEDE